MDWITNTLAIGNFLDARKVRESEVEAILCLKSDCCNEDNREFDILCVPLVDGAGNCVRDILDAINFVDDVVSNGDRILIHCHAGRSRSVCIAAKFLMRAENLTSHQALQRIEKKRDIYLSPGIEEILTMNLGST